MQPPWLSNIEGIDFHVAGLILRRTAVLNHVRQSQFHQTHSLFLEQVLLFDSYISPFLLSILAHLDEKCNTFYAFCVVEITFSPRNALSDLFVVATIRGVFSCFTLFFLMNIFTKSNFFLRLAISFPKCCLKIVGNHKFPGLQPVPTFYCLFDNYSNHGLVEYYYTKTCFELFLVRYGRE